MAPIDYNERYMKAAKNDYKYLDHTAQGLPVLKLFQNKYGFLEVITKNNSGYIVGHHYDPATGEWVNGIYGFDRYTDATEYIFDNYVIRNVFDPSSPIDVRMEYAGKFNYNHTSQDYLSKHNHRDPDFDIYGHVSPFNDWYYSGGKKPSREEFEGYLTKYRMANQPTRSLNKKKTAVKKPVKKKPFDFYEEWDGNPLVCKECGYNQYDEETIEYYIRKYPGESTHDIQYICGACLDNDLFNRKPKPKRTASKTENIGLLKDGQYRYVTINGEYVRRCDDCGYTWVNRQHTEDCPKCKSDNCADFDETEIQDVEHLMKRGLIDNLSTKPRSAKKPVRKTVKKATKPKTASKKKPTAKPKKKVR